MKQHTLQRSTLLLFAVCCAYLSPLFADKQVVSQQVITKKLNPSRSITARAFFGDDGVLCGHDDGTITVWDITGPGIRIDTIASQSGNKAVESLSATQETGLDWLIAVHYKGENNVKIIRYTPMGNPIALHTINQDNIAQVQLLSNAGKRYLAVRTSDGTITVWEITQKPSIIRTFNDHKSTALGVAGDVFVSGDAAGAIYTFNPTGKGHLAKFDFMHPVTAVGGYAGKIFATTSDKYSYSNDYRIKGWDTKTSKLVRSYCYTSPFTAIGGSPKYVTVFVGGDGKTILRYPNSSRIIYEFAARKWVKDNELGGSVPGVYSVALNATFVAAGNNHLSYVGKKKNETKDNPEIVVWDYTTAELKSLIGGQGGIIESIVFNPSRVDQLLSASRDNNLRVNNYATAKGTVELVIKPKEKAELWYVKDTKTNEIAKTTNNYDWATRALYDSMGGIISCSFDTSIRFWETNGAENNSKRRTTGKVLTKEEFKHVIEGKIPPRGHSYFVTGLAYNQQTNRLASGSYDTTVQLWDAASGAHQLTINNGTWAHAVAFSPDGSLVAAAGGSGPAMGMMGPSPVNIWSTSGSLVKQLNGHPSGIFSVAFSPDGTKLATAGANTIYERNKAPQNKGTVIVWDVNSGQALHTFSLDEWAYAVDFTPDGNSICVGSFDNMVGFFNVQ